MLSGQIPLCHVDPVGNTPGDDGAVGIAGQEVHDDLLAYAGQVDGAIVVALPVGSGTHPAGTVFVALADPVPVELHLHPAELVDP
ncbi:hypothetical protein D3C81_834900 [compost metagenome]